MQTHPNGKFCRYHIPWNSIYLTGFDWKGMENRLKCEKILLQSEWLLWTLATLVSPSLGDRIQFDKNLAIDTKHTHALTHTGTLAHIYTHRHPSTHKIEPAILNFWMGQSLVIAIVKAMSISGTVK